MKFSIKAYAISEQGKYRSNQEDTIFPSEGKTSDSDRLFILCDGMGGHEKGEVASAAVCEAMSKYILSASKPEGEFSDDIIASAVEYALDVLDKLDDGSVKKMGTTMVLLKLHEGGATIAHIGDSRCYQIRPSKNGADATQIMFKTRDHSLVNDLIRLGEMTEEEARVSKQKNVITRAMMPHLDRRPKADIAHITDIQPDDYFYLCSDGMLDQMNDTNLKFIFSKSDASDLDKVNMLKGSSLESSDNHSAHIIHIL